MTRENELADRMRNQYYSRGSAIRNAVSAQTPLRQASRQTRSAEYDATVTFARPNASATRRPSAQTQRGTNSARPKTTPHKTQARTTDRAFSAENGEIKMKKKYLSPIFILALAVVSVMMLGLVTSFCEVYQTANDVSTLENRLEALHAEEEALTLKLDDKNDIREIETIATNKLGMVKEDSLQKKFVSLSEGERIDVLELEETNEQGGVLLSAIFSAIGDFFSGK